MPSVGRQVGALRTGEAPGARQGWGRGACAEGRDSFASVCHRPEGKAAPEPRRVSPGTQAGCSLECGGRGEAGIAPLLQGQDGFSRRRGRSGSTNSLGSAAKGPGAAALARARLDALQAPGRPWAVFLVGPPWPPGLSHALAGLGETEMLVVRKDRH